MYGWLWRHLPGPVPVRVVLLLVLAAGVLALLFGWVFPQLEPRMPWNQVDLEAPQ